MAYGKEVNELKSDKTRGELLFKGPISVYVISRILGFLFICMGLFLIGMIIVTHSLSGIVDYIISVVVAVIFFGGALIFLHEQRVEVYYNGFIPSHKPIKLFFSRSNGFIRFSEITNINKLYYPCGDDEIIIRIHFCSVENVKGMIKRRYLKKSQWPIFMNLLNEKKLISSLDNEFIVTSNVKILKANQKK